MAEKIEVPEELADVGADRIKQWREWGVAAVEAELTRGGTGLGLRSGSSEVQKMAWRWIAWEKAHAEEGFTIKATPFGIGAERKVRHSEVKALWRKIAARLRGRK
jgi:hypothetical protein